MCLGIPGQIVRISNLAHRLAMVDVMGVQREINIACIIDETHPVEACVGDWVLVHVGFAMNRINETEAQLTLDVLKMMGEAQAEMAAMQASDQAVNA